MNIKRFITVSAIASLMLAVPCFAADKSSGTPDSQAQVAKERDAASGLPTGKRQHKPVSVDKRIDKASPKSAYRLCPDGTMINPGEKCPEKK